MRLALDILAMCFIIIVVSFLLQLVDRITLAGCDTDIRCMEKFGGPGDPEPIERDREPMPVLLQSGRVIFI